MAGTVINAYFDRVDVEPDGRCLYKCLFSSWKFLLARRKSEEPGARALRSRFPVKYVDPKALNTFISEHFRKKAGASRKKWGKSEDIETFAEEKHVNVFVLANASQSHFHNAVFLFTALGGRSVFQFQTKPRRVLLLLQQKNTIFLEWCVHGDDRFPNHYNLLIPKRDAEIKLSEKVAEVEEALRVSPLSSPEIQRIRI